MWVAKQFWYTDGHCMDKNTSHFSKYIVSILEQHEGE